MRVKLRSLKPNPTRDFIVDPIDRDAVRQLVGSIQTYGFWGGVTCRKKADGTKEIGAGHHRVEAALACGIDEADLTVFDEADCDDAAMMRLYAVENATQRGHSTGAQDGVVAAAILLIAKMAFGGGGCQKFLTSSGLKEIRGNLAAGRGIGQRVILRLLEGVPGVNAGTVEQSLASLKAGGEHDRILAEAKAQVEREQAEALQVLQEVEGGQRPAAEAKPYENLKKGMAAADQAAARADGKVTFDAAGVRKHLKNAHQVSVFRKAVTGPGVAPYLPVKNQAELARRLVKRAGGEDKLSGAFIKENVVNLVLGVKEEERRLDAEEREELERRDRHAKAQRYWEDFARTCRVQAAAGMKLLSLLRTWPKGEIFPVPSQARDNARTARDVLTDLLKSL